MAAGRGAGGGGTSPGDGLTLWLWVRGSVWFCSGLTFTQEPDQAPDEVAAAVAEGGLGQGDPPEAVTRSGALVLVPGTRGLLAPLLRGHGARCPAVRRVELRRTGPARLGHVLPQNPLQQHGTRRGPIRRRSLDSR